MCVHVCVAVAAHVVVVATCGDVAVVAFVVVATVAITAAVVVDTRYCGRCCY